MGSRQVFLYAGYERASAEPERKDCLNCISINELSFMQS